LQNRLVTQRTGKDENPTHILRQQVSNAIDLGSRLDALGAHTLIPAELQEDLCLSLGRTREHLFDTR